MPDIPQQQTIVQYVANSHQLQYVFDFYAPLPTDIQVYYQAANAVPIPSQDILLLNSQYTVTYNLDPTTGGFITLLFTPTTGFFLTINRNVQASLNTNFANAQTFNGANLNQALDRLLLLCQQNQNYALFRNLSYIINTYSPSAAPFTQLPPLLQNQVWLGSGAGVTAATISQVPSASVLQSLLASQSPGTDGARIVGYYDAILATGTTVDAFLTSLNNTALRVIGKQLLTVGSGNYVPTVGTKFAWARGLSGGGGGAGCSSGAGEAGVGGGGGAGSYGEVLFAPSTLAYTAGAAGLAGTGGSAGTAGGSSSLGSILALGGGQPGQPQNAIATTSFGQPGIGGIATIGDLIVNGNPGGSGWATASVGGVSGSGGNSPYGAGGYGLGNGSPQNGINASIPGYGAGGGGGLSFGATSATGGAATPGFIEIIEFG